MGHVVSIGLGLEIPSDQFLTSEPKSERTSKS